MTSLTVRPNATSTLKSKLTGRAFAYLKRSRRLKATVTIEATRGTAKVSGKVVLTLRR
jgi:hypothetical protein